MLTRRDMLALVALSGVFLSMPVRAAEPAMFTLAGFEEAQKAGRSILVEVHAPWCPTCRAQGPILAAIREDKAYRDLVVFKVDFDTQKDALKRLNAQMQSTLITFKGARETGRSVGDTKPDSIAALVAKAL